MIQPPVVRNGLAHVHDCKRGSTGHGVNYITTELYVVHPWVTNVRRKLHIPELTLTKSRDSPTKRRECEIVPPAIYYLSRGVGSGSREEYSGAMFDVSPSCDNEPDNYEAKVLSYVSSYEPH